MILFKSKRGFTMLELILVLALIGLLSSVVYSVYQKRLFKERDEVRRADIKYLQLALERYYAIHKRYPSTCNSGGPTNNPGTAFCTSAATAGAFSLTSVRWFYSTPTLITERDNCPSGVGGASCREKGNWIPGLVTSGVVPFLPRDPREGLAPNVSAGTCATRKVTYRYRSTGAHYKLQAFCGIESSGGVLAPDEMHNPATSQNTTRSVIATSVPMPPSLTCASVNSTQIFEVPACW